MGTVRSRWRKTVFLLGGTLAANLLFFFIVDRAATTADHLTVTLAGERVSAALNDGPPCAWDRAPAAGDGIGMVIRLARFPDEAAGIDNLVVRAGSGGAVVLRERFGFGMAAAWRRVADWSANRRGQFVSAPGKLLWLPEVQCTDCAIDVDLENVAAFDLYVRARDDRNALLLRREGEVLAWFELKNGVPGDMRASIRLPPQESAALRFKAYAADIASILLPAYLQGWRFIWWYARAAAPGLAVMLFLGFVWHFAGASHPTANERSAAEGSLLEPAYWPWLAVALATVGTAIMIAFHQRNAQGGLILALAGATVVLILGGAAVIAATDLWQLRATDRRHYGRVRDAAAWVVVIALATAGAAYSAYAAVVYLEDIPHVQDSVSYLLGAKAIASGQLRIPIDPALGPFFDLGQFFEYRDGYMYPLAPGLYFAGYPALLAIGWLAGAPWIVNPLIGAITVGLLFLLGRNLFGTATGLIAAALATLSPFVRFQSAAMMTHPAALLFVTAGLLLLVSWMKRGHRLYALGVGLAVGALLNVRPYEAGVLSAFLALVTAASASRLGRARILDGLFFAAVGFSPFFVLIVWQSATLAPGSGGGLTVPHHELWELLSWIPESLDANRIRLESLNEDLFGWTIIPTIPSRLAIGLLLMALLVMPKTRADWFVVGWALLYVAAYASYAWHGNMFGPRYWYPSIGGQLLLIARFLQSLPQLAIGLVERVWPPGRTPPWRWLSRAVGAVPMIIVAAPLFWATLSVAYPQLYKPEYGHGYNGFTGAPLQLLRDHGVTRGVVFVADLPSWQDLVTAIGANDANLSGELIFARHIEGKDQLLIKAHADRPAYAITWNGFRLELGKLDLNPAAGELAYTPVRRSQEGYRVGASNIFTGLDLPGGAPLQGGIDVDQAGNIYVLNSVGREVFVFDSAGVLQRRLCASYGFGPAAIRNGHGMAVDSAGNVYITDIDPPGLVRLNADGSFAWRLGGLPGATGADGNDVDGRQQHFAQPFDVEFLPSGNLVVSDADAEGPHLHVVRPDGTFQGYYEGDPPRVQLGRPFGLAIGPTGHLFVSDFGLKALLELNAEGVEVRRWALPLQRVEASEIPYVAVDARGHAYVADHPGWTIYHADPSRTEVESLPTLPWPSGLAIRGNQLMVVEAGSRRLRSLPLPDSPTDNSLEASRRDR